MKATLVLMVLVLTSGLAIGQTLPTITSSPTNTTVYPGVTAGFTVTATGATGYQWLCNGTNIAGATSATLQVPNAQSTNCGYYMVLVKNATGWVPSQMAYLTLDYTYGGTQPTACGILPFSNTADTYFLGVVGNAGGASGTPTNGTVQLMVGPQLDQMQPVGQIIHFKSNPLSPYFNNGYYNSSAQSVPTILPGQTVYYGVVVNYTNNNFFPSICQQRSTIMNLVAGTNGVGAQSAYGLKFPTWWAAEGLEPFLITYPLATNQLRVFGETGSLTLSYGAYNDFGYPTAQWRKNGEAIFSATNYIIANPIDGSGISVLTITNVQASDAGIYDLIVYGNEWVVSPKIALSIQTTNGQGLFQSPKSVGTNFICNLAGAAGRNYQIQWSTNMTSWNNLTTLSNATGTVMFTNGVSRGGAQFYRTVLLP